jgi:hypothetical protein
MTRSPSLLSIALTSTLLAAACGDDTAATTGSGGGGGGSTTTSQGGAGPTTSTTSQGGSSPGSGGSGGSGDVCNPDAPTPISIEVRNDTDVRLWLAWSNTDTRFVDVEDEGSPVCACEVETCEGGGVASVVEYFGYLEPGESISRTWSGLFHDGPAVPECSCFVGRRPAAGDLVARAEAFTFDCQPGAGVTCECPLATDEACSLAESGTPLQGQPSTTAEATFSFPDDTTVVVSFTEAPGG